MDHIRIDLDAAVAAPDADEDALGVSQGTAAMIAATSVYAVVMALREPGLSRRERRVGVAAASAAAALGLAGSLWPRWLTRTLRQRVPAPTLPVAALATLAGSKPDRSPMYLPAVLLTAMGAGTTSKRRSPVLGGAIGTGYLVLVVWDQRPWRHGWDRQLWWNVSMWPAFAAAAPIGAILGNAALSVRALERARERDRRIAGVAPGSSARSVLVTLARDAGAVAREIDELLLRIARTADDEELHEGVGATRERIHHFTIAPILMAGATEGPLDLGSAIETVISTYTSAWNGVTIEFRSDLAPTLAVDARTTTVLVGMLKIALDNADGAGAASVHVRLRESAGMVDLQVEDDGGATVVPARSIWGTGLTEALHLCESVGGSMPLEVGARGLIFSASVPRTPVRAMPLPELGGAVGQAVDRAIRECEIVLRVSNLVGGIGCLMTAARPRSGALHAVALASVIAVDQFPAIRQKREGPTTASLAAIGLVWPTGGRPASGWIGAAVFFEGLRRGSRAMLQQTMIATGALGISAIRTHASVVPGRIAENLLFPIGCAAAGLGARHSRTRLGAAEADAVQLRERNELVEALARGVWVYHGVIKPVRETRAWRDGLMPAPEGQRLIALSGQLLELVDQLKTMILIKEPLRELQEHLATRLAPTPVTIDGELPVADVRRADDQILERARQSIARIALADLIAQKVIDHYPTDLLGRWRLERLHITVHPITEDLIEVAVRPIPPRSGRNGEQHLDLVRVLSYLHGELKEGFGDGWLTFTMASSALVSP